MKERYKDLLAGLVLLGVFFTNQTWISGYTVGHFVTFFSILYPSYLLGRRTIPGASWFASVGFGSLLYLALQSIVQTAWFYAGGKLDLQSDMWTMGIAMLICLLISAILPTPEAEKKVPNEPDKHAIIYAIVLTAISGVAAYFVIHGAWVSGVTHSIRTPWPLMPSGALLALALAWLSVLLSAWLVARPAFTAFLAAVAIFSTTAIAPLIYRIGFGFDGFLHIASEKIIQNTATLSPKPLYYMGQYVFTTWLSRFTNLPVEQLDRWLVPVAAAIFFSVCVYFAFARHGRITSLAAFLLLPLGVFVATTPQSLAYILGLSAILLALDQDENRVRFIAPLILTAWGVAAHPLAGIPFSLMVIAILLAKSGGIPRTKIIFGALASIFVIGSAISVPAMFLVLSKSGNTLINWQPQTIFSLQPWSNFLGRFLPYIGNHYVFWPAWSTLTEQALPCLLLLASIITLTRKDIRRTPYAMALAAAILFLIVGALLKSAGEFAFLIDYERGNYADRLNTMSIMLLFAAALPGITALLEKTKTAGLFRGTATIVLLLSFSAGLAYGSLPRHDAMVVGRGWSTSATDIEAVRAIQSDADKHPYTVLANQSVSAAAVLQFGFQRYAADDVFYYPIPTGGPLYQIYLDMTYKDPTRAAAQEAGRLGDSSLVYVVINDYWWRAEMTNEALSAIADEEMEFGDATKGVGNSIKVYKFDLSKPSKAAPQTDGS